jgi:hypothetical protein
MLNVTKVSTSFDEKLVCKNSIGSLKGHVLFRF